ncbi:MAG: hypothetical protein O3B01_30425 [Planctomycetota bacterium]|nr:hypothetical protein [Planctomycetota bacterium]MDA1142899.1 hypothetical protein [Planctomycetota bacterium]
MSIVLLPVALFGQQTNNHVLQTAPAKGAVNLDGQLTDWDLSGEILMCYDLDKLLDTNSVRAAAMYDREYLYLSFQFKDRSPMLNHVDPEHALGSGWRSDSVQLRLWTDHEKPIGPGGARVTHIDCYWFTDGKKSTALIQHHDMGRREEGFEGRVEEAIGNGVEAAFRKDADGQGYTQEMRVAWKHLRRDGRPYKAGEVLRMGLECFWGDASAERWYEHRLTDLVDANNPQREFFWTNYRAWGEVKFMEQGNLEASPSMQQLSKVEELRRLRYSTSGPVAIEYELPKDSAVTLVIEKSDGERVRNLIADYPRKAGKNIDFWDGADDNGRLMEPGEYRVRGLTNEGLDLLYQFSYGSAGNPPWPTSNGKGSWLSDHSMHVGAASDGERVYFSAFHSEAGDTLMGVDVDGQRQWGLGRIDGGMLARHDKFLYMLAGGVHPTHYREGELRLLRVDPKTGKFASFPNKKNEVVIFEYPKDRKVANRMSEGATVAAKAYDAAWCRMEAMGLAASEKFLFVSLYYENKILVLHPDDGLKVAEYSATNPTGLATNSTGDLYVLSGKRVLHLDPRGQWIPIIEAGLDAPIALAIDPKDNLYISDWGASMCVKVFSPQGKYLRTIGKPGGRPLLGKYEPDGFFRPWGLAIDSGGRLWVAEHDTTPKRISVWTTKGKFVREFIGPGWYNGTENNVNTVNPKQAFSLGSILELDWKKGSWRVTDTLWRPTHPKALLGPRGEGMFHQVVEVKGKQILVSAQSNTFVCISRLEKHGANPLAALGHIKAFMSEGGEIPELLLKNLWDDPAMLEWARKEKPELFSGNVIHRHRLLHDLIWRARQRNKPMRTEFIWTDANGDSLVQDEEVQFFAPEEMNGLILGGPWRFAFSPDLTFYPAQEQFTDRHTWVWRMPVKEWNEAGAPVYDPKSAVRIVHTKPLHFLNSAWADSMGSVLSNQSPMQMHDKNGKRLWQYPNRWPGVHGSHKAPKDKRGLLIGPLKVIGSAEIDDVGEVFCLSGNLGKAFIMTTEGLFVGSLFRDARSAPDSLPDLPVRGMSIMQTTAGGEWFGGEFFRNRMNKKIYLGSSALNATNISEVVGLDRVEKLKSSTITLTQATHTACREYLINQQKDAAIPKDIEIQSPRAALDGNAPTVHQLNWETQAKWNFDGRHTAEATWSFDDKFLYVGFREVLDDTPMINKGPDATRLFKTGDACILEMRTKSDDDTGDIVPGDFRLVLSVFEGKQIAVAYHYKVPGTEKPFEFSSPVMTTKIDMIKVIEGAKFLIRRGAQDYDLTAAVPLAEIGFNPEKGMSYRGDFGIVYSDKLGKTNSLRMNWSNLFTSLISDLALESAIEPKHWGWFRVKKAD